MDSHRKRGPLSRETNKGISVTLGKFHLTGQSEKCLGWSQPCLDLLPEPLRATWVTTDQLPLLSRPRFPWILDIFRAYTDIFTMRLYGWSEARTTPGCSAHVDAVLLLFPLSCSCRTSSSEIPESPAVSRLGHLSQAAWAPCLPGTGWPQQQQEEAHH